MGREIEFGVGAQDAGARLDSFVAGRPGVGITRSQVQRLIQDGSILVNGGRSKPGYRVKAGDAIEVRIPEPEPWYVEPQDILLPVVYEDSDVIVIDKPRGMVVHPAAGHRKGTLANFLVARCPDLVGIGGTLRPGIVHRLDRDTTGLMVVAKTERAYHELARQLKERVMQREYLALVHGHPTPAKGRIELPIGRHPANRKKMGVVDGGRRAITNYEVVERFPRHALVRVQLETGRTHQIRVHMSHMGWPVVGDRVYGRKKETYGLEGQALHAARLRFRHPSTGAPMELDKSPPEDMMRVVEMLRASSHG